MSSDNAQILERIHQQLQQAVNNRLVTLDKYSITIKFCYLRLFYTIDLLIKVSVSVTLRNTLPPEP